MMARKGKGNMTHTMESVLMHHGITGRDGGVPTADDARDAYVMHACLGCGSITTAPDALSAAAWRELLVFDCCPDADDILF